jgi:hypothetical protein
VFIEIFEEIGTMGLPRDGYIDFLHVEARPRTVEHGAGHEDLPGKGKGLDP